MMRDEMWNVDKDFFCRLENGGYFLYEREPSYLWRGLCVVLLQKVVSSSSLFSQNNNLFDKNNDEDDEDAITWPNASTHHTILCSFATSAIFHTSSKQNPIPS